jgi:hypothetical protein
MTTEFLPLPLETGQSTIYRNRKQGMRNKDSVKTEILIVWTERNNFGKLQLEIRISISKHLLKKKEVRPMKISTIIMIKFKSSMSYILSSNSS